MIPNDHFWSCPPNPRSSRFRVVNSHFLSYLVIARKVHKRYNILLQQGSGIEILR